MHFHLPIFIHSYIFLSLHTYTTPKYARHPLNPRPIHIGAQYHRTPIPTPTHTRKSLKGSYGLLRRPYTGRLHNLSSSFQTLKTFTVQLSACYSAQLLRNPALHLHLVYIISTPTPVHPDQPTRTKHAPVGEYTHLLTPTIFVCTLRAASTPATPTPRTVPVPDPEPAVVRGFARA